MARPRIGITVDNIQRSAASGQYCSAIAYSKAVTRAGGLPLLLPHDPAMAREYVVSCDGLLLTGGDDPAMEPFGETTDPRARVIDPTRQAFELAMLDAAASRRDRAVLGVCLGMQLMALHAGGRLNQYLPDTLSPENAKAHQDNHLHEVSLAREAQNPLRACVAGRGDGVNYVVSSHRQAVAAAGSLSVIAQTRDGTIEAIADLGRPFYVGVQWHPERAGPEHPALNAELLRRFVDASRSATS
ncbi:gamma-glutamyl-gamma-aminobutyrate hydrolase family protein [Phycisphaerales bacterium AB-hyl4]|uniref:Gamma-glutamyl-gamma-aminobutyrate hydrolase family protein n=1 Tax=Natronomicrosphaera hydrolytica TaxID=3242702 RepID=A0ABV4U4T0_9BACT